jgi:RNA polymerase sigma-70 factor (ECF subfamily)
VSAPVSSARTAAADPLGPLLERYLVGGDEAAIEEVVRRTRPRLLVVARSIGRPHDAEDAVQAAYLSLVRKRGERLEAPVFPWLLTAVVRIAYRRKAIERRQTLLAERLALPHVAAPGVVSSGVASSGVGLTADAEELERLRREVERLPAAYRDPVVLHHLHGLSTAEVGRLLDLPDATIRTRLHRARRLVRSRWSPRFLGSVLAVPWWIADGARSVSTSWSALSLGVVMKATAATTTVVALLAAAVGVGLGFLLQRPRSDDDRAARAETALEAARAEVASLKRDLAAAQDRAKASSSAPQRDSDAPTLEGRPAAPPVGLAPAKVPEQPADPSEATAVGGARYRIPGFEGPLDEVDWTQVGTNLSKMKGLMDSIAKATRTGVPLPPETIGRIQTLNGPLVTAALKFEDKVKTGHPNAAFTHPAFQANVIAATLKAAGVPLTDAQSSALEEIGIRFSDEETKRTQSYDATTFELTKVCEEAQLRDRFYEAAFGVLQDEQRNALVNPDLKDRLQVDLFSSGLIWLGRANLLPFKSFDLLSAAVQQRILGTLQATLDDAQRTDLARLVDSWLHALPADMVERPADAYALQGSPTSAYVTACAAREVSLLQQVVPTLRLDAAAQEKLRSYTISWVLLRQPDAN